MIDDVIHEMAKEEIYIKTGIWPSYEEVEEYIEKNYYLSEEKIQEIQNRKWFPEIKRRFLCWMQKLKKK